MTEDEFTGQGAAIGDSMRNVEPQVGEANAVRAGEAMEEEAKAVHNSEAGADSGVEEKVGVRTVHLLRESRRAVRQVVEIDFDVRRLDEELGGVNSSGEENKRREDDARQRRVVVAGPSPRRLRSTPGRMGRGNGRGGSGRWEGRAIRREEGGGRGGGGARARGGRGK